ncbi:MAG: Fe-S cluster assembly protein SufD [Muribaculaceae bacterium]|nr:Fe-S cluster assembly protein SufD [Muribaculaceae bacterium]
MDALAQYLNLYREHSDVLMANAPEALNRPRPRAYERLMSARLPRKGDEGYPALSVEEMFAPDYGVNLRRVPFGVEASEPFRCGVPNVSTLMAFVVNDSFRPTATLERNLPDGVEVMSLARAAEIYPDVVAKHYDALAGAVKLIPTDPHSTADAVMQPSAVSVLNTLLCQDGVFVRVKAGVRCDKPLQIVNISNASAPLLAVRRMLVIVEDGASCSILTCDHAASHDVDYLNCQVTEAFLGRGASLDIYDLEESSARTARHAQLYARQDEGSEFTVNGTTLVGGRTRNSYYVELCGEHARAKLAGMAIGGDEQAVENATCVIHRAPKTESDQLFKNILDDKAEGAFYGSIIVDEKADFTKAYQINRNIVASPSARMHTRPQLEIYCDEVKCSHGATVGQIDENAMFYMRQRGIPERQARMMLMQAFMADVIDTVSIPALKSRLAQLVELRLSGTRELCAACER